jgi:hypothetical protein
MPYIQRIGQLVLIDCAARPPNLSKRDELEMMRLTLEDGDMVRVDNASDLSPSCWADILHFASMAKIWQGLKNVGFTCIKPPRVLLIVLQTLELPFKTTDALVGIGKAP